MTSRADRVAGIVLELVQARRKLAAIDALTAQHPAVIQTSLLRDVLDRYHPPPPGGA